MKLAVYSYTEVKDSEVEESVYQPTSDRQTMASSIMKTITNLVAGSDDDKQTIRQTDTKCLSVGSRCQIAGVKVQFRLGGRLEN